MKSSIIIPTAGRTKSVKMAIQSLLAIDPVQYGAEIIVVDNNVCKDLSDELERYCAQFSEKLSYIHESSPGLTAARHAGVLAAKGELLTFIDDDVEITPGWLPAIQRGFVDPSVVMVGGPSIPKFTCSIPAWFWDFVEPTPFGGWCCSWLSLLDIGRDVHDFNPNYIWGLNFSIRKEVLLEFGGFHIDLVPKKYSRWQGDGETGLTLKIQKAGRRVLYSQDAMVMHLCGPERLNVEYFQKRATYQGIADSYRKIRSGTNQPFQITSFFLYWYRIAMKESLLCVRRLLLRRLSRLRQSQSVRQSTEQGYREGFFYHQREVAADPRLLKWVRQDNYLSVDLREEIGFIYADTSV